MEDLIKNIITEKRYFELTQTERSLIKDWAENEEEFDALKRTFQAVSTLSQGKQANLSPEVKNRLKDRFAAKHGKKNESIWNKFSVFFFPSETSFFKKPAFQLAMVALVILLIIPFLWQDEKAQYAMNESQLKIEKLEVLDKVKHTSSKEKSNSQSDNKVEEVGEDLENELKVKMEESSFDIPTSTNEHNPQVIQMENNLQTEDVFLEEMMEVQSPIGRNDEVKRLDDLKLNVGKDMSVKSSYGIATKVETSETLGLLMALY